MKTLIIILTAAALNSCSLTVNPDGSKEVSLDAIAAAKIINSVIAEK